MGRRSWARFNGSSSGVKVPQASFTWKFSLFLLKMLLARRLSWYDVSCIMLVTCDDTCGVRNSERSATFFYLARCGLVFCLLARAESARRHSEPSRDHIFPYIRWSCVPRQGLHCVFAFFGRCGLVFCVFWRVQSSRRHSEPPRDHIFRWT